VAEVKPVPVTPPAAPVAEVKPEPVTPPATPVAEVKPEPVATPAPAAVAPAPVEVKDEKPLESHPIPPTIPIQLPVDFCANEKSRPGAATLVVSLGVFLLGLAVYAINMLPLIRMSVDAKWKMREVLSVYAQSGNINLLDYLVHYENLSLRNSYICWGCSLLIMLIVWLLTAVAVRKKFMGWVLALIGLLFAMLGSALTDFIIQILHTKF
ncbi:MAG: hypothetical protein E7047_06295, partial [Lentisphaerae bacterium]|nr:hypothetical protein [Lentisphaerota bacterium]